MCPVTFVILGQRKPMTSQKLSDVPSQRTRRSYLPAGINLSRGRALPRRRDWAKRCVDCGVVALFPGGRRQEGGTNRRPHVIPGKSPLFRSHCYLPGGVDHTRGMGPSRTTNLHEAPPWHCCPGYVSGGRDHVDRENTDIRHTGPEATRAARPRFTSRGTLSPGREARQRARNAQTKHRPVTVACDICPVALFHPGGSQISGGDMIERPCHFAIWFSLRRNLPIPTVRREGRRGN